MKSTFADCKNLETIKLPEINKPNIAYDGIFYNCTSLKAEFPFFDKQIANKKPGCLIF